MILALLSLTKGGRLRFQVKVQNNGYSYDGHVHAKLQPG